MWRRAWVLLLGLVLVAVPVAAQVGGFGHRVDTDMDDERYQLQTDGPQYIVLVDEDGNDRPTQGEAVFLSTSSNQVSTSAIRIANPQTGEVGSRVQSGDPLHGVTATQVDGRLTFRDVDADGALERGEPIYWETDELDTTQLEAGDVQLAGEGAGAIVRSSNPYVGQSTDELSGQFGYTNDDGTTGYGSGDRVFLDVYEDGWASIPDIRLTTDGPGFGSMLTIGDSEITYRLHSDQAPEEILYIDGDADGTIDGDERVFLADDTDRILGDAIRLVNPINGEHGSYVGDDPRRELGDSASQLSGTISYNDADGDGDLDPDEILFYDLDSGDTGTADGNDLILSGPDAGSSVRESSTYRQQNLDNAPGTLRFLDQDASDSFTLGDVVYLDADNDRFVSGGDVQLTNHTAQPATTDTDGDGVNDAEDNCPDTANTDQADLDEDGTGDACDDDRDGDTIANGEDNCPDTENTDQADADDDGEGDACDATPQGEDGDGDGVNDDVDNCPNTENADQADADDDGTGDACDATPTGPEPEDADSDGTPDDEDNCPNTANADQADTDGDGAGDACDGDIDGDGLTNVRERGRGTDPAKADTDGDGVDDPDDNCPTTENAGQADTDADGVGDACAPTAPDQGIPGPGALAALLAVTLTAIVARSTGRRR